MDTNVIEMNAGKAERKEPPAGNAVHEIPLELVQPPSRQVRLWVDPHSEAIKELAASIRGHGLLNPLSVFAEHGFYRIIAGERRYHAARLAGLETVSCLVHPAPSSESELWELQLVENVQREDLSPIEEGTAYRELNERLGLTLDVIGERVGKSKSYISRAISIARLPEDIKLTVVRSQEEGRAAIPFEHLSELSSVHDPSAQRRLLQRIIEFRPTVRELRAELRANENDDRKRGREGWSSTKFSDPEGQFFAMLHFKKKHITPEDIERAARKILEDAQRARSRGNAATRG